MKKDKSTFYLICFALGLVLTLIIYFALVWLYINPTNLGKSYILSDLSKEMNKKGLNFDWDKKPYSYTQSYNMQTKYYSDLDYYNFSSILYEKFEYSLNKYDCKFFALTWAMYFEKNKIPYKFEYTSNHIFIIAYIENGGFCIANLQDITCYVNNGNTN